MRSWTRGEDRRQLTVTYRCDAPGCTVEAHRYAKIGPTMKAGQVARKLGSPLGWSCDERWTLCRDHNTPEILRALIESEETLGDRPTTPPQER